MAKGKTTKRERKFAAKGGVKARLDKGGTIAPKGKVKRKRRNAEQKNPEVAAKKARREEKNSNDYAQQQKTQKDSEDFVGRENLGDLDVKSFFANFEEDLKNEVSGSSSEEDSDNEEETKTQRSPMKKIKDANNQKKEESDSSQSEDIIENSSSDNESEEEEKTPQKKKNNKQSKTVEKATRDRSDSESEDDDIEAAEARMKAEMKKLQRQDPEFHEFLKENEESLLEFGDEEALGNRKKHTEDDIDDDIDDGAAEDKNEAKVVELTPKLLENLEHGAFVAHGVKSLKKIVKAYKSACLVASASGDDNEEEKRNKSEKTYHIEDSQVFDRLMVSCLDRCHEEFHLHLLSNDAEKEKILKANSKTEKKKEIHKGPDKKKKMSNTREDEKDEATEQLGENSDEEVADIDRADKPLDPKILESSPRWMEVKPIVNTFLKATLHIISESKEPELLAVVLKALSKYVRYMTAFPRIAETMLKTLTNLWSAPVGDSSEDYQVVRLDAFLRIRQLALTQPFPFIEDCLKKTYLAYARRAKFGGNMSSISSNTLPTLTFLGNCLVELYSLDYHSSYQHAFVYIRQLALFLRTALQKKTPEAFQNVYCWQYLHCLKVWVAILAASCKQFNMASDGDHQQQQLLRSLVYPLTEVILGTIRLAPAPARHLPLRFHCIRLLQQLAAATETYIPTTSILLEALDLKEFSMKPKKIKKGGGATTRGVQLPFLLKLSKEDPLRTSEELEACVTEVFKLLNREVDLYRYSAGFPEFSLQLVQRLKKFSKDTKNGRWRAYARGCIELCERYTDFAVQARSKLAEAPKDVKTLECLRQPTDPSMGERYDKSITKENAEWTILMGSLAKMEPKEADDDGDEDMQIDDGKSLDEENTKRTNKKKQKKSKKEMNKREDSHKPTTELDGTLLEVADEVQEGIDWSSDED